MLLSASVALSVRGRARSHWVGATVISLGLAVWLWPAAADAYIGPGAGIAFATSAFALLISFVLAVFGLLFYPFRLLWRLIRRRRPPRPPRIRRAVLIGLDGLDPDLCKQFMDAGRLPNLSRLAASGCFHRLGTTLPPMSPVAWSSFATGVKPGRHGIFDFLTRDPRSYQPDLSSAEVRPPRRFVDIGPYRLPLSRPEVKLLRRSKPFWDELSRHGVPASILRVPITFPPDRFDGTMLSAMCVPDLEGTQGTFSYFTEADDVGAAEGGRRVAIEFADGRAETWLEGPPHPFRRDQRRTRLRMRLEIDRAAGKGVARLGGERVELEVGHYSPWIPVGFPIGFGLKMRGICRLRLLSVAPHVRLYLTPVQIDPENPVLPISHPRFFAPFLAKLCGRFATLGLAEDTWALNEGVLDEDAFLEQVWSNHQEREAMFFAMLRRTRRGLVTCVFDGTDRLQHMFMRYVDDDHPARDTDVDRAARYRSVIEDTYARMDEMVGRAMAVVDPADPQHLFAILSDHGFKTFRRGINLNAWLMENGYLHLEPGRTESGDWFAGVDWSRTRAFALGLSGLFLNVAGREAQGIVKPEEAEALADEIADKLAKLIDPGSGKLAVSRAYAAHRDCKGPYADQAPDVIVGYAVGWRVSWEGARGVAGGPVFSDNTKAWSGDHCIDPELVPGVLIANRPLGHDGGDPHIIDLAPTVLDLFGVPAPRHMQGKSLAAASPAAS